MLNDILSWMTAFNVFLYTAAAVFTALTVVLALLTSKSRLSAPLVKLSCIITNRSAKGYARLSLILSRAVLLMSCVFARSKALAAVALALALTSAALYCLAPAARFIIPDLIWTALLFNVIMVKDALVSYLREVSFDYMVLTVTVLACIFIFTFNIFVFLRAFSEDLRQCALSPSAPRADKKKDGAPGA